VTSWRKDKACHCSPLLDDVVRGVCKKGNCARFNCAICGGVRVEWGPVLCRCEKSGAWLRQMMYPEMAPQGPMYVKRVKGRIVR
jgi:hypothetical protein